MALFSKSVVLYIAVGLLSLAACKKGSSDTSILVLDIHTRIGADSLIFGHIYQNSLGQNISFSRVEYYISNIQLTNTNGSSQQLAAIVLDDTLTGTFIVGSVPVGTYNSLSFNLGVTDSNHVNPANYTSPNPLAAQTPTMHFSTNALGYIFLAVEGLVDSSASGTGVPSQPFSYHIGLDSLLRTVSLPNATFNATGNRLLVVNIAANLATLLNNVNMKNNPITNTTDYPVLADTLANHFPAMFSYE